VHDLRLGKRKQPIGPFADFDLAALTDGTP
jgi:hypothetical protein